MAIQKVVGGDWTPKYIVYLAPALMMAMMINQFMNLKTFDMAGMSVYASVLTYPLSLVVCDLMSEVYGYKRTRRVIYVCLVFVILTMLFIQLAVYLPPANDYTKNDAFVSLFKQLPRLALASVVGYFVGELLNSYTMSRLKTKMQGRFFYFRALFSTAFSQIICGSAFMLVAFLGTESLTVNSFFSTIFVSLGLNLLYEIFFLPVTKMMADYLKRHEGVDYYEA